MSIDPIRDRYLRFASHEAHGRSPLYEEIARGVSADTDVLRFLESLPLEKQQPNLLFAAVRHLLGVQSGWPEFRASLLGNADAVRSVMMTQSTQTNEPGRCATLLPLLAQLPGPLALLEVGASAGLCLLPDFYDYDFGWTRIISPGAASQRPLFACNASRDTPLPAVVPKVVWRAGLDLSPLDATNPKHVEWLQALVWPEQQDRLANLQKALQLAAQHCVQIEKGSLLTGDLDKLCALAPKNATLVIFHTAVLSYIPDQADRIAFSRRAQSLAPYWVSNESPVVFPGLAPRTGGKQGQFLLSVNGTPVAWTDPHGAVIDWIA